MLRSMPRILVLTALMMAAYSPALLADKHIVEEITLDDGDRTAEAHTWLGTGRMAYFDPFANITTIVRRDINKLYIVLHDSKEVIEIELPLKLPEDFQNLFSEMKMRWRTSRLNERRTIGGWDCNKVVVRGRGSINVDIEMWMTDGANIDSESLHSHFSAALKLSPLFSGLGEALIGLGESFTAEISISTNKLGLRSSSVSRVKSIFNEPPHPKSYEPPEDFQRIMFDFKTYLQLIRLGYRPGVPAGV